MGFFRFGRGDFFGIIIPGAFLLTNLLFVLWKVENEAFAELGSSVVLELAALPVFLVASYAFGFALRLVSPNLPEQLSVVLRIVGMLWRAPIRIFRTREPRTWRLIKLAVVQEWHSATDTFPYRTFFADYLRRSAKSVRAFYREVLQEEFGESIDGKLECLRGLTFFNQCKLAVLGSDSPYRDEAISAEGLSRFVAGMTIALVVSLIGLWFINSGFALPLAASYSLLVLVFAIRLPHVRAREATMVFVAYARLAQPGQTKLIPGTRSGELIYTPPSANDGCKDG